MLKTLKAPHPQGPARNSKHQKASTIMQMVRLSFTITRQPRAVPYLNWLPPTHLLSNQIRAPLVSQLYNVLRYFGCLVHTIQPPSCMVYEPTQYICSRSNLQIRDCLKCRFPKKKRPRAKLRGQLKAHTK